MKQYRSKPVVIEAIQYDGSPEANRTIIDWARGSETPAMMENHPTDGQKLSISTLEGSFWVTAGDWVIKGTRGEFYPCKPDVFERKYEPVEPL